MARQRRTGGGGCLAELVIVTLLVWPIQLLQPVCRWSDAETGGLEVVVCGLLAIAASVRARGSERTAPEIPNQDADGPRAIVAPRVAWDRSLVPSRRSNGPWADHPSNLGLLIAPGRAGLDSMRRLAEDDGIGLPIFSHPAFQGTYVMSREHGISHQALFGQLPRLAGADATISFTSDGFMPSRLPRS